MITTQSDLNSPVIIQCRARDMQLVRGIRSSLAIRLARRCKLWPSLAPGRRYGARRSPLSDYISLHLSLKLTTKCVPLSRLKLERYIFIKKCVSFRSLKFVSIASIMILVGSMKSVEHAEVYASVCSCLCVYVNTILDKGERRNCIGIEKTICSLWFQFISLFCL